MFENGTKPVWNQYCLDFEHSVWNQTFEIETISAKKIGPEH